MADPMKNDSNFLDNLPLTYSEDSETIVPISSDKVSHDKEESGSAFQLISKSLESRLKDEPDEKKLPNINKELSSVKEDKLNSGEKKEETFTKKFEFKLEDSSVFTINIIEDHSEIRNFWQEERKTEEDKGLNVEIDHSVHHDLKSYRPKERRKSLPWTLFGAGLAALVVLAIIIIKIRRALKRYIV